MIPTPRACPEGSASRNPAQGSPKAQNILRLRHFSPESDRFFRRLAGRDPRQPAKCTGKLARCRPQFTPDCDPGPA
jgi:hypothetical protein